jgi:VWFA-related protein
MVDVSVRDGWTQVQGLTAGDFVLLDNGVKQRIESVEATVVPIDLTLVVDTSGTPRPILEDPVDPLKLAALVNEEVRQAAAILRPDDRIRVLAIETYGSELLPFQPVAALPEIHAVAGGGLSSFYDVLVSALLHAVEPTRRHIIVARTTGRDSVSIADDTTISDIAGRSDALLHLVMMEEKFDDQEVKRSIWGGNMHLVGPTARYWLPFQRLTFQRHYMGDGLYSHPLTPSGLRLARAAELTGGALHQAAVLNVPSLFGTFKKAFDDFRSSYMLRYSPQGVAREGWHDIKVTIPSRKNYTVHARRGYAIESATGTAAGGAATSTPAAPARGATSAPPRALDGITAAFGRGDVTAATTAAQAVIDKVKLLRDFQAEGNPWPLAPRREAVLALILAEVAMTSQRNDAREEARLMLVNFHRLVRDPLEPDDFERLWLAAEIAALDEAIRPAVVQSFVRHALARFPNEPRFVLALAFLTDQRWPIGVVSPLAGALGAPVPPPDFVTDVITRYEAAVALPETATEARIRLGWFLHRLGRDAEALERLDAAVDDRSDTTLPYLRQLMRGHVLVALGRLDPALDSYRAAAALRPGAQSARVGLMNALLLAGRRTEAEAMAETIQAARADAFAFDPWSTYWQGDQRLFWGILGRLREMAR